MHHNHCSELVLNLLYIDQLIVGVLKCPIRSANCLFQTIIQQLSNFDLLQSSAESSSPLPDPRSQLIVYIILHRVRSDHGPR